MGMKTQVKCLALFEVTKQCQWLSHVRLSVTPWTVACQASLSMEFSRQGYWSGLPFSSPGDHFDPRVEPRFPTLQTGSSPSESRGSPHSGRAKAKFTSMYLRSCCVWWPLRELRRDISWTEESEENVKYGLNLWSWCNIQIIIYCLGGILPEL